MQRLTTLLAIIVLVLQQVGKTLLRVWFSGRAGKIAIGVGVFVLIGMCGALGDDADAERTAVQPTATVVQVAVQPTATRSPSPQAATPTTAPTVTTEPTAAPTNTPEPTATEAPTNTPEPTATTVVLPTATTAAPAVANCDPSYPDFCLPPAPPDLNCDSAAVGGRKNFTVLQPDPHQFDREQDGVGCEQN